MSSPTICTPRPSASPDHDRVVEPLLRPVAGLSSSKVLRRHLEGLAIVYIRQSSPQQVLEHRESTRRQYGLVDYAVALGWPADRVLVIDEDQGQSGKYLETRVGFQRILAEVGLDHVGIVLGLEMSRLARSDKDWHHLLEVCGIFGTLLADQDGVYDAADPNDRLLLGLKGTISSVELQTMRNRLEKGKLNKALRGELFLDVPIGYVKLPNGAIALDPDEQVQTVIRLIFGKFEEFGTVRAVFRYLLEHGIRLGVRPHDGPQRDQLQWRRPTATTLYRIFHHPFYAGTYAYGRFPVDPKRQSARGGRKSRKSASIDEWKVRLPDCVPGYISWETYLANQERLRQNCSRWETTGAARSGSALLGGLVRCGRCGARMQIRYSDKQGRYDCVQHLRRGRERECRGLATAVVDRIVEQQLLRALEPAALEVSLAACDAIQQEREQLGVHWQQQRERARYESDQAERRYRAVDPENRLVARTLEQQWEQALRNERQLAEDYDRFRRQTPHDLSQHDRNRIQTLAHDIPALWKSPDTSAVERKEIVRCLVEKVIVHVQENSEHVDVAIHWMGGFVSQHQTRRPVAEYRQMRDYDQLVRRLRELKEAGPTAAQITNTLNQEGYHPTGGRRSTFAALTIRQLLSRLGLGGEGRESVTLDPQEWWLNDLAHKLQVSSATVRRWISCGWVHARRTPQQGYYILWADEDELARLAQLRDHSRKYPRTGCPPILCTPKRRSAKRPTRTKDGKSRPMKT